MAIPASAAASAGASFAIACHGGPPGGVKFGDALVLVLQFDVGLDFTDTELLRYEPVQMNKRWQGRFLIGI